MSLKLVGGHTTVQNATSDGRAFAPGAPLSPGAVPDVLMELLERGEAVIWWDEKQDFNPKPALITALISIVLLLAATALAPAFWEQSILEILQPVGAMMLPALFMASREFVSRSCLMVSDRRIFAIDWRGRSHVLPFSAVELVRRDLWSGGIALQGPTTRVKIPPTLMPNARRALASQLQGRILGSGAKLPIDSAGGWFPQS